MYDVVKYVPYINIQLHIMNKKLRHQKIDMGLRCIKGYKIVKERSKK